MSEVELAVQITPMTLRVPWRDAAKEIHAHLKIGRAIKNQKIRDQWELDHARAEKAEWIRRTQELLTRVFTSEAVAEQCLEYVGPVLPEYAEFDLFIDSFEDEMRHRLDRLQVVLKQLDTLPEAIPLVAEEVQAVEPAAPEEQPIEVAEEQTIMREDDEMTAVAAGNAVVVNAAPEVQRQVVAAPQAPASQARDTVGLLILATQDQGCRKAVGEFLRDLGLTVEVIDRVAQPGRSVVDLLKPESSDAFAVVLADANLIREATGEWQFELGYCAGRLGAGRVCVASPTTESMGEKHGIKHFSLDGNGGWQLPLARHLKRAGVAVDLNRLC
jgi:predicted nucleotide-binding protein